MRKQTWRPDEPARQDLYRSLKIRIDNQDSCITWLLVELRAVQKRLAKLEKYHESTAAIRLRMAHERLEEVRELEQRGDLPLPETGDPSNRRPPADTGL